jgi:hypothetical protein
MSLLKELVSLNRKPVKEMDFEFGGSRPQPGPETTDGPMPNGGDDEMDDYKDFKTGDDGADDEYGDQLEGEDSVECDVPFLIKMLEWAHEEAQSDEEIHKAVENMIALDKSPLTMDDYDQVIPEAEGGMGGEGGEMGDDMGGEGGEMDTGAPDASGGDHPVSGSPLRNGDTSQNNSDKVFRMK